MKFISSKDLSWFSALALAMAGCGKSDNQPARSITSPPQPPPASEVVLKKEELAAVQSFQNLIEQKKYVEAGAVVAKFPDTPGMSALKTFADAQQRTPEAKTMSAMGFKFDVSAVERLKPVAIALRDKKVSPKVVSSLLADPDDATKLLGIGLLVVRRDPSAADAIRPLMNSSDSLLRTGATAAMAFLRDGDSKAAVETMAKSGGVDEFARHVAEYALLRLDVETGTKETEEMLQRSNTLFRQIVQEYEVKKAENKDKIDEMMKRLGAKAPGN